MNLARTTSVVSSPHERRSPVPAIEWPVVLDGCGRASNVGVRFLPFRTAQKTVTHLHCPVLVRHETQPCRTRVPAMSVKVVAVLVRLSTIEDRTFEFEPAISESRREYAKRDMRRVLQVMRERRGWIL